MVVTLNSIISQAYNVIKRPDDPDGGRYSTKELGNWAVLRPEVTDEQIEKLRELKTNATQAFAAATAYESYLEMELYEYIELMKGKKETPDAS